MSDAKITQLTDYTTPIDTDVLPIVDVTNDITKKIAVSTIFPASVTDNMATRFDGTTGKKLQGSPLIVGDVTSKNAILDFSLLATADKTFTFPNTTGTFALQPTAWTSYTPTVTAESGTPTTATASGYWTRIGTIVMFKVTVTITNKGTATGAVIITNPVTATSGLWMFFGREDAATGTVLQAKGGTTTSNIFKSDNNTCWVDGYSLVLSGFYEAA